MADKSKIEWTESTWNPILGCSKISPGCKNCYAIRTAWRLQHNPNPTVSAAFKSLTVLQGGEPNWTGRVNFVPDRLEQPLRWREPRRIFVNSQSDLFHENLKDSQIGLVLAAALAAPQHTYQILTKRAQRMKEFFLRYSPADCYTWAQGENAIRRAGDGSRIAYALRISDYLQQFPAKWTDVRCLWLGVSAENQECADKRIPELLQTPAAVRWVSAEPLLGPIDLDSEKADGLHALGCGWDGEGGWRHCPDRASGKCEGIDWVVVGGESGPKARPMHPDWARSLRDQCAAASVPFFFKQWGAWLPDSQLPDFFRLPKSAQHEWLSPDGYRSSGIASNAERVYAIGKKAAGRLLDGVEHSQYPEVRP